MNALVYRHEYKHAINWLDYHTLRQRIKAVAHPDPNAETDGRYHVRSLYFDNDDDKALREKLYGLPDREKFRIRIYNMGSDIIRLEKKSKIHGLCRKQSTVITKEQTERILAGDVEWMPRTNDAVLAEFYGKMRQQRLRPRTIVDYWREAYAYFAGNVRITFDSDVRTGLYATGLFDRDLPTVSTGEQGILLLEVKYDEFLPDIIRDLVQTNTRRTEAFSKYAASRMYG